MKSVSPTKATSSVRYDTQAGVCPGVRILTGVHGFADGTMIEDYNLYEEDVANFGSIPGVNVYNIASMTPATDEISTLLKGAGTPIGALCNSGACLLGP